MRAFIGKSLMFLILLAVLSIGVLIVGSQVQDRESYRQAASASIAASHAGEQMLAGLVLNLPFRERYRVADDGVELAQDAVRAGGSGRKGSRAAGVNAAGQVEVRERDGVLQILPDVLGVRVKLTANPLRRGLFRVNTYDAEVQVDGSWVWPVGLRAIDGKSDGRRWIGQPQAVLGLSDVRGVTDVSLSVLDRAYELESGSVRSGSMQAVTATLDPSIGSALNGGDPGATRRIPFHLRLKLQGIGEFSVLPLARQNRIDITSNWPSPSFSGSRLPDQREVRADGFEASWNVSSIASAASKQWLKAPESNSSAGDIASEAVAVRLIDPVDVYTLTDRATKYAILFIVLTLASFALYELLGRLRIHPIQYLLVGVALLLFYLLLLSLSERLGFARAYLVAATADIALIVVYLTSVLGGWRRSLPYLAGLSGLYAALYVLLHSEQNALLLGTLLLFGLLSALMVGTRRVDWFELFAQTPAAAATPQRAVRHGTS